MGRARPGDQDRVVEDVAQVDARVGAQRDRRAADVLGADGRPAAGHPVELLDQAARDRDAVAGADDGQLVAARVQLGAGLALDELEVGVALAEERERDAVVLQGQAFVTAAAVSAGAAQASLSDNDNADSTRPGSFNRRFQAAPRDMPARHAAAPPCPT